MTPQEAIRRIQDHNEVHSRAEKHFAIHITEALNMAVEALEKQIPKKVTHEATLYKCCTCPNCKNVVDEFTDFAGQRVRVTYNYCRICGQTLDWSDTE